MKIHDFRGYLTDISAKKDALEATCISVWTATLVMWYADIGNVLDDGRSTDDGKTKHQKKYNPLVSWEDCFGIPPLTESWELHVPTCSCNAMRGVLTRKIFVADKQIRYLQNISQAQAVPSNTRSSIEARSNRILLVNFTPEQVVRTRALLNGVYDVRAETIGHDDWATLSVSSGRPKKLEGYDPQVLNQFLENTGCTVFITSRYSNALWTSQTCSFAKWCHTLHPKVAFEAPWLCARFDIIFFHDVIPHPSLNQCWEALLFEYLAAIRYALSDSESF